jgi:tricarballylate dehydrogenase
MRSLGVRFVPAYGGQSFQVDGKFVFWGGLTVQVSGGGRGLVDGLVRAAERRDIGIIYETRAVALLYDDGRVAGVRALQGDKMVEFAADAVVLGCGGFEANAQWRAQYLGSDWDLAKVRGTRFNIGDGIRMALDVGAQPYGHWSGCHAVGWDRNAPATGDLAVGDGFQKHSYPFGIMVNARGERFVDEGRSFRNYTYAEYGRQVLMQPSRFAWQVFDSKVSNLLREEYRIRQVTKVTANSAEELAERMDGVDSAQFLRTLRVFNSAVTTTRPFNPTTLDGRCTEGIFPRKSNWANTIDEPPFEAYAVTCGITFTFGGLRIDTSGQVQDVAGQPIGGLYACGELVGGIFFVNYPGGSGLTAGSVLGRVAGTSAARSTVIKVIGNDNGAKMDISTLSGEMMG